MKRLAWRGEPGKGRQRIGSRGKLAAGNSRLDSTRLNSPFFFFSFFLSSALSGTLFSVSRERTACIGVSAHDSSPSVHVLLRVVHTDVCIQGGAFSHDVPRHRHFSRLAIIVPEKSRQSLFVFRGIFHLRGLFTPRVRITHRKMERCDLFVFVIS